MQRTQTAKQKNPTAPVGKVGQRREVVIPQNIFKNLGLEVGDRVEVQQVKDTVVIKPKKVQYARDELTPKQRAFIDRRLAQGMKDIREGRTYGPFTSTKAMLASLHSMTSKKAATQGKSR